MLPEVTFFSSGIVFGLSGGLSPGPLLTLVISETLKHGTKEGVKVSIAPLLPDLPIVLVTLIIMSQLAEVLPIMGMVSLLGGTFLFYLGLESLFFKGGDIDVEQIKPQSIKRGVIANFLNPSPYMFWFTIGAPLLLKALNVSVFSASLFILGFYLCLVGSKVLVAVVIGKSRSFLSSQYYIYTVKSLGIILMGFAIFFFRDSLRCFGLI